MQSTLWPMELQLVTDTLDLCACFMCSSYPLVSPKVPTRGWVVRLTGLLLCYAAELTGHVLMAAGHVPFSIVCRKFMHSAVGSDVLSAVRALQMRVRRSCCCCLLLPV